MSTSTEKLSDAYYPMLVFTDALGTENQMWEVFRSLGPQRRAILVSAEVVEKIQELEKRFQLQEVGVAIVSFAIRKMLFGELDTVAAEEKVRLALRSSGGGDPVHARAIVEAIQNEVMTIIPAPEPVIEEETSIVSRLSSPTVKLPLLKAMSEYRHIAEQMLTAEKIKLRGSVELVRPSLGNWLKAYREELGVGFHEPVQRGSFLFQSQNGKRLSSDERARLNLILKSVEEEFPLEIDTEHQTIIFPPSDEAPRRPSQPNVRPINPADLSKRVPESAVIPVSQPSAVKKIVSEPDALSPAQSFRPIFSKPAVPEKNVSGETLHFSTGHVLPAEREASEAASAGNTALRQMQHPTQGIRRIEKKYPPKSPYSIRPLRSQNGSGAA